MSAKKGGIIETHVGFGESEFHNEKGESTIQHRRQQLDERLSIDTHNILKLSPAEIALAEEAGFDTFDFVPQEEFDFDQFITDQGEFNQEAYQIAQEQEMLTGTVKIAA